ncbi:hypothetical protein [Sphingomonas sp. 3P27F8]|uniref:hypothetical protein n=1 Tax=Sphingomonas sp. 3P27F8 TaxID=2502213 RepID=UPI0010F514F4|nr:hypothetical protein [Sphingomonas sp. 3P27F8]
MAMMETIRVAEDGVPTAAGDGERSALNAVGVTVGDLAAARRALGNLAHELRWDGVARRDALTTHLDVEAIKAAAIDARLVALRKWQDLHDPERHLAEDHVMDAAAIAPLVDTDHGLGFDDAAFGELVEFIGSLPW